MIKILGLFIAFLGLPMSVGGIYLWWLGGSVYYALAGSMLVAAGWLIFRQRFIGVWLYILTYMITIIWAFWEADGQVWALLPRLFGLSLVLVLLLPLSAKMQHSPLKLKHSYGLASLVLISMCLVGGFYGSNKPVSASVIAADTSSYDTDPSLLKVGADWPAYGGTYAARRSSPLQQINTNNIRSLERAWIFHTGDMPEGDPSQSKYAAETTPLKIGDLLYLCTATNILIALDANNGQQVWRHNPGVKKTFIPYSASCRGVAYYEDGSHSGKACEKRIIEGTLDGRLIAVDAMTGERCMDFANAGAADITIGMGEVEPGMVAMTSAPTIIKGVVVTGHQVKDGVSVDAPSGVLQGFDALSGEHLWAWDMGQANLSNRPNTGSFTRGTPNMWTTASGDEELGLVYMPMGNSAGDYLSSKRSAAEDSYSTALVAMDVLTGKPVWHFRAVDIDVWDYDLGSQATLVDFPTNNGTTPALILPSKQGDIYVLDRLTGKPLTEVIRKMAPNGGVEPSERAKTQPFSGFHTLAKPPLTERDMWGMSPIDQMLCRIQFRQASYAGIYTPPTTKQPWIQYPGYNGGSDWGGVAVDTKQRIIVANYNDIPNYNRLIPRAETDALLLSEKAGSHAALAPQKGAPYGIDVNAGWRMPFTQLLCKEPPYGGIRAINLDTGEQLWDRPLGTARRNGPFGIPSMLPFNIGTPNNGGAVITAGGLIFIAAATDDLIRAIDINTGETLWQDTLPAGGQATPMTYEHQGKQYVVIMAGGHHFMNTPIGDALIAYALPD
jgi:quinoprotein glucose dehydrogenase